MLWIVRILGLFLVLITLLPLLSTGKWYVRWWDFPRFQIAILLLIPLGIAALLFDRENESVGTSDLDGNPTWLVRLANLARDSIQSDLVKRDCSCG